MNIYERFDELEKNVIEMCEQTAKTFITVGMMIGKLEKKINDLELKCT